jgi:hypothetical protein
VPTLNWSLPIWSAQTSNWEATVASNTVAVRAADDINVVPLPAPLSATDWSYTLQFFGPSLDCSLANSTEQSMFDNVTQTMEQENIFTYSELNDTGFNAASFRLLYSAWSAWLANGSPNWWLPRVIAYGAYNANVMPQIFIQTSTQSIVCNSVNASFDVTISFVNGSQQIIQNDIQFLGNYSTPLVTIAEQGLVGANSADGFLQEVHYNPYLSHFYAIGSLLSGNITLADTFVFDQYNNEQYATDVTTSILTTGLTACDDIANSPFKNFVASGPEAGGNDTTAAFINTFPSSPWMCRNHTLMAAIEDLANNITISYLSTPDMTGNSSVLKTILTSNTVNKYQYHPFYLLFSYGLALLFSSIAAMIGFWAMHLNGVSHSMNFSAIVATTRNPELDALTGRSSLGADPVENKAENVRLKFGPLLNQTEELKDKQGADVRLTKKVPHIAFGSEEHVGQLRKGGIYT